MASKAAKVNAQLISVSELHPYPVNPNEQDALTFGNLVREIEQDGFEEPLAVVPRDIVEPGEPGFTVVSGNHRLEAVKRLKYDEVDCVLHNDWDADTCKVKVMRRNQTRGKTNSKTFSKLVDSMNGYTHDQLSDAMGFRDIDEFAAIYEKQTPRGGTGRVQDPVTSLIDGLSIILNKLFSDYGDTVPYSFMYFLYGKKVHLTVQTTPKLKRVLMDITTRCNQDNLDAPRVIATLLESGMETLDFMGTKQVAGTFEDTEKDTELVPTVGPAA